MEPPPRSREVLEREGGWGQRGLPGEFPTNPFKSDGVQYKTTLRKRNMLLRQSKAFRAERDGVGGNAHFKVAGSVEGQDSGQCHTARPARGSEFCFGALF